MWVRHWHHYSTSCDWGSDSAETADKFGNENYKIPHTCTLSTVDGGRMFWCCVCSKWKVLQRQQAGGSRGCCLSNLEAFQFHRKLRDIQTYIPTVTTWNPTGGAVQHMDMYPEVHMASNQGMFHLQVQRQDTFTQSRHLWNQMCWLLLSHGTKNVLFFVYSLQRQQESFVILDISTHLVWESEVGKAKISEAKQKYRPHQLPLSSFKNPLGEKQLIVELLTYIRSVTNN